MIDVAAAIATFLYGLLADWTGLDWTFAAMALLTLAVVALAAPLRSRLNGQGSNAVGRPGALTARRYIWDGLLFRKNAAATGRLGALYS